MCTYASNKMLEPPIRVDDTGLRQFEDSSTMANYLCTPNIVRILNYVKEIWRIKLLKFNTLIGC